MNLLIKSALIALLIYPSISTSQSEERLSTPASSSGSKIKDTSDVVFVPYKTPEPSRAFVYLYESFDDVHKFKKDWVRSQATKAASKEHKYNGTWDLVVTHHRIRGRREKKAVEEANLRVLHLGDYGLRMKNRSRHHAISRKMHRPFDFKASRLILQYDVQYRNGQDCGGAYLKLLTSPSGNLSLINDQTPYTIMFGPDKCGSDHKLHFIFSHVNRKTGVKREIHWKNSNNIATLSDAIIDGKWHLFRLIISRDNTFEILMDKRSVGRGSFFQDFSPSINADPEIFSDEEKPEDWDDREMIPDPDSMKPQNWDSDEPAKIPDPESRMPDGWLEDEPIMIFDPTVRRPHDWNEERDGPWEAPMIKNPKCELIPGCGPWSAPLVENPLYRGEWKPPLISNPNYQGKWSPKKVANPNYFEDKNPYEMQTSDAVAFELWTMSDGIIFDNILVTNDLETANMVAEASYQIKKELNDAETDNWFKNLIKSTNKKPWLWAVYLVVIAVPLVLFIGFCCVSPVSSGNNDPNLYKNKATHPFQRSSYQVNHDNSSPSSYSFGDARLVENELNDYMNTWEADQARMKRFQTATGCSYRPTFEQFKEKLANIEESERFYEENEEYEHSFEPFRDDKEDEEEALGENCDESFTDHDLNAHFQLQADSCEYHESGQAQDQDHDHDQYQDQEVSKYKSSSVLTGSDKNMIETEQLVEETVDEAKSEREDMLMENVDSMIKEEQKCLIVEKPLRRRRRTKGKKQEERNQRNRQPKGKAGKLKIRRD